MTGAIRNWWWLIGGLLALLVGVVLIASVPAVATCADFGVLPDGSSTPPVPPCQQSIDAAQRNWAVGSVFLLVGLAAVAYDFGYRRGWRSGNRDSTVEASSS